MVRFVKESNIGNLNPEFKNFKQIVKIVLKHKGKTVKEFADWLYENLKGYDFYDFMFAVIVFGNFNKCYRNDVWDALFGVLGELSQTKYKEFALDTYYNDSRSFSNREGMLKHCMYVYWKDIPLAKALYVMKSPKEWSDSESYDFVYPVIAVTSGVSANGRGDLTSDYAGDMKIWYEKFLEYHR